MLDHNTEIAMDRYQGTAEMCQRICRRFESRNFEVLSVSWLADHFNNYEFLITTRRPKMLYVNYEADTAFPDGEAISISYQAGPYPGMEAAEQAEREIIMATGLDRIKDIYITGQREHTRTFIGSEHV